MIDKISNFSANSAINKQDKRLDLRVIKKNVSYGLSIS